MKTIACSLIVVLCSLLSSASAQEPAISHPFVCTDYIQGKVFIVSAQGKVTWEYPAPHGCDVWALPNGNLLFSVGTGSVKEVTRDKKVVFSYEAKTEIFSCQRLPDGNTLIGECNTGRLVEVDPKGKVVKELRLLPEGTDGGHIYMRKARRLANGNYLVALFGPQVVREYDPSGKIVMEIPAPGGPFSAIRLPNGNTLISCGDILPARPRVFEVDPEGKTVWQVTHDELPGAKLWFMTGLQRLPNGNTLMANWLGHGHIGDGNHLIEVTRDKKVVWTFADHKAMKTITSVQLLDVPGDVTKGEILH